MSTIAFRRAAGAGAIWTPAQLKQNPAVGDGTAYPFGLTSGQLMDAFVYTSSMHIEASTGSGDSDPLSVPFVPGTNVQDILAGILTGGFPQTIVVTNDDETSSATANILIGGPVILNPSDGLFYPWMSLITASSDGSATSGDNGMGTCGTCSFWGVGASMYVSSDSPSDVTFDITPNTKF